MRNKIKNYFTNLTKRQVARFAVFLVAAVFAYFMAKYGEQMSRIGYVVLFIELGVVVLITWGLAGHTVMKTLFAVSVGLSLLIYLAQSYCDVPITMRTVGGDAALMSLVGFGILYVGIEFLKTLRREISERLKQLTEMNNKKRPWFIVVPYGLFTGIFAWQVGQVLMPIINSLCVYHK